MAPPHALVSCLILLFTLVSCQQNETQLCVSSPMIKPTPIWTGQNGSGPSCALGYYCPFIEPNDNSTWPSLCPSTPSCSITRLASRFCTPQGKYEPRVCTAGYFCPNHTAMLVCPEGSYCPIGCYKPRKCTVLSYCPEGSSEERFYGVILIVGVFDLFVFASTMTLVCFRRKQQAKKSQSKFESQDAALQTLCAGFNRSRGGREALEFRCDDLSLKISKKKQILHSVTSTLKPGHVTAIMGPSGAGKTSFMNCLMGKVDSSWQRGGTVRINGEEKELSSLRKVIGHVPQDDIMLRELTVWDNLMFSAKVRLPREWTREQLESHVQAVVECLNLTQIKHSTVGDERDRGISGGQRRRVSIGLELASAPLALFLDEPTTGLDATSAMEVCRVLREVAEEIGLTVVMVIHQPRVEIWDSLDNVLILAPGGKTVFEGPRRAAELYFSEVLAVGFKPKDNPADVMMDALSENGDKYAQIWSTDGPERVAKLLSAAKDKKRAKQKNINTFDLEDGSAAHSVITRGASFFHQVLLCHNRAVLQQLVSWPSFLLEVALSLVYGVFLGLAASSDFVGILHEPYTLLSPAPRTISVPQTAMFISFTIGLAAASAGVRVFGDHQTVYWREAASGHDKLAYYIGASFASLYRVALGSLHFSGILYILSQMYQEFWQLYVYVVVMYGCVYSLASVVSMVVSRENSALLAVVLSLVEGIFSGSLRGLPFFLKALSYAFWASEGYFSLETEPIQHIFRVNDTSDSLNYVLGRWGLDMAIVFAMAVGLRILSFLLMIILNRDKQR